jgi:hypothetical protein
MTIIESKSENKVPKYTTDMYVLFIKNWKDQTKILIFILTLHAFCCCFSVKKPKIKM